MNYALTAQVASTVIVIVFMKHTLTAMKPKDKKKENVYFICTFLAMIFVLVTLWGGFAP